MPKTVIADVKRRMEGGLSSLAHDLKGLRTGRASPALLEGVRVEAYGDKMPIEQLGTVSAPEARLLTVQVWDQSLTATVEKAITNAGLGLNPSAMGSVIRVPLPDLSEQRRKELVKVSHQFAEKARVALRNVRRDGMDAIKKLEKDGKISQDDMHNYSDQIQKLTDEFVKKAEEATALKEKDIMEV